MSVLSDKTIRDFAKVVNTAASTKNNDYSMAGTVKEILEEDLLNGSGTITKQYVAKVLLDGGNEDNLCTATYNGIVCSVGDRVVVTIQNNLATITENYTNPNGNTLIAKEIVMPDDGSGWVFSEVGSGNNIYELNKQFNVSVPSGYSIVGLKSISMQYATKLVHETTWSNWKDLADKYLSAIHLGAWNFDGNTIRLRYGAQTLSSGEPNISNNQVFKLRFRIIYTCMIASAVSD